jgi:hypothetical protein
LYLYPKVQKSMDLGKVPVVVVTRVPLEWNAD